MYTITAALIFGMQLLILAWDTCSRHQSLQMSPWLFVAAVYPDGRQTVVTVPPIGPDELPPPYTPSPQGGIPMINCKVCQSMINIEGKTNQHVVKCSVCNEATVRNFMLFFFFQNFFQKAKYICNSYHFWTLSRVLKSWKWDQVPVLSSWKSVLMEDLGYVTWRIPWLVMTWWSRASTTNCVVLT